MVPVVVTDATALLTLKVVVVMVVAIIEEVVAAVVVAVLTRSCPDTHCRTRLLMFIHSTEI